MYNTAVGILDSETNNNVLSKLSSYIGKGVCSTFDFVSAVKDKAKESFNPINIAKDYVKDTCHVIKDFAKCNLQIYGNTFGEAIKDERNYKISKEFSNSLRTTAIAASGGLNGLVGYKGTVAALDSVLSGAKKIVNKSELSDNAKQTIDTVASQVGSSYAFGAVAGAFGLASVAKMYADKKSGYTKKQKQLIEEMNYKISNDKDNSINISKEYAVKIENARKDARKTGWGKISNILGIGTGLGSAGLLGSTVYAGIDSASKISLVTKEDVKANIAEAGAKIIKPLAYVLSPFATNSYAAEVADESSNPRSDRIRALFKNIKYKNSHNLEESQTDIHSDSKTPNPTAESCKSESSYLEKGHDSDLENLDSKSNDSNDSNNYEKFDDSEDSNLDIDNLKPDKSHMSKFYEMLKESKVRKTAMLSDLKEKGYETESLVRGKSNLEKTVETVYHKNEINNVSNIGSKEVSNYIEPKVSVSQENLENNVELKHESLKDNDVVSYNKSEFKNHYNEEKESFTETNSSSETELENKTSSLSSRVSHLFKETRDRRENLVRSIKARNSDVSAKNIESKFEKDYNVVNYDEPKGVNEVALHNEKNVKYNEENIKQPEVVINSQNNSENLDEPFLSELFQKKYTELVYSFKGSKDLLTSRVISKIKAERGDDGFLDHEFADMKIDKIPIAKYDSTPARNFIEKHEIDEYIEDESELIKLQKFKQDYETVIKGKKIDFGNLAYLEKAANLADVFKIYDKNAHNILYRTLVNKLEPRILTNDNGIEHNFSSDVVLQDLKQKPLQDLESRDLELADDAISNYNPSNILHFLALYKDLSKDKWFSKDSLTLTKLENFEKEYQSFKSEKFDNNNRAHLLISSALDDVHELYEQHKHGIENKDDLTEIVSNKELGRAQVNTIKIANRTATYVWKKWDTSLKEGIRVVRDLLNPTIQEWQKSIQNDPNHISGMQEILDFKVNYNRSFAFRTVDNIHTCLNENINSPKYELAHYELSGFFNSIMNAPHLRNKLTEIAGDNGVIDTPKEFVESLEVIEDLTHAVHVHRKSVGNLAHDTIYKTDNWKLYLAGKFLGVGNFTEILRGIRGLRLLKRHDYNPLAAAKELVIDNPINNFNFLRRSPSMLENILNNGSKIGQVGDDLSISLGGSASRVRDIVTVSKVMDTYLSLKFPENSSAKNFNKAVGAATLGMAVNDTVEWFKLYKAVIDHSSEDWKILRLLL